MRRLVDFVKEELNQNRRCYYSIEYSDKTINEYSGNHRLSSEEHSEMSEKDFAHCFESREQLVTWYFSYLSNMNKLHAVAIMVDEINTHNISSLLSLGAGPCVLEYLIKMIFSRKINIVCTDYDMFMVEKASKIFEEMVVEKFDFYKDDIVKIVKKYSIEAVVLFGSACSMDSKKYIEFLRQLRMCGVKRIYTFEAAIISDFNYFKQSIEVSLYAIKKYITGDKERRQGAFHAYKRSKSELKNIYKKAGWRIEAEKNADAWPSCFCLQIKES